MMDKDLGKSFIVTFVVFIITLLIYFLDYYPFTQISFNNAYCTNMKTNVYLTRASDQDHDTMGIYYYESDIYDEINGTFIGKGNGGYGTFENCYLVSAGISSDLTYRYPYSTYKGNIPAWLCSHVNHGSSLWSLEDTNDFDMINQIIWPNKWEQCKYSSIEHIKKSPWNVPSVAQAGDYDYLTNIDIYGSTFSNLNDTDHGRAAIGFMALFGLVLCIIPIYYLIKRK